MASTESEVRALVDRRTEAIRSKDLDGLMAVYSPDIVYFDVPPPLRHVGHAALRERFTHWFDGFEGGIGQEIDDMTVSGHGDLAAVHMLVRSGGTLKTGREVGLWVRATSFCQRSDDGWSITHEHVSVPVDLEKGTVAVGLEP